MANRRDTVAGSEKVSLPAKKAHILSMHQRLPTSGARAVEIFQLGGQTYLAVPQLAQDVPGQPPHMNAGNSNIEMQIFRWANDRFEADERLPVPGGEDAEFFTIGDQHFLATASVRTGNGPYEYNAVSNIYLRVQDRWQLHQSIPTFAAKQWHHFRIGSRHFLALAQGVTIATVHAPATRYSRILEWNGTLFQDFQTLDGVWGYNYATYSHGNLHLLGYADHAGPSRIYRWSNCRFEALQDVSPQGGRAFAFFQTNNALWLAFANIVGDSLLYRWNGEAFVQTQVLGGPGGRELSIMTVGTQTYLVRVCFIAGTPASPKTDLVSQIYQWRDRRFEVVEEFATFGATDVAHFRIGSEDYLAVSNSLTRDVRFREDTVIYRMGFSCL